MFTEYSQKYPMQISTAGRYYEVGAVFNSPRACLRAETIARSVSFAAFSSSDLTALTFGCTRRDAEKFFPQYIYDKIYLVSYQSCWLKCGVCIKRDRYITMLILSLPYNQFS